MVEMRETSSFLFFFFNDPPTTEIYTLSLHDALPIWRPKAPRHKPPSARSTASVRRIQVARSEEHTSELQSRENLVCRLLLEKKKKKKQLIKNKKKKKKKNNK